MIQRLVSAALVAGFLASVVATGLELALTSPLIVEAERYEGQAAQAATRVAPAVSTAAIVTVHTHGQEPDEAHGGAGGMTEWQPAPGLPRMAFTGLATLVGGVGYALLLGAVMLALRREPTPGTGLALGIAGFGAVALAPALGLPPELPGMEAAVLELRQAWWLMTVVATGLGLYLIAVRRVPLTIAGGLVLIVAPHLAGAPHAAEAGSRLPADLAAQFAARSLGIAFVFWSLIGLGYGWAWARFGRPSEARAGARA